MVNKRIKFINPNEDNLVCEGILKKDKYFGGGYKIIYKIHIMAINFVKVIEDE